jgi:hypothetical protein
MKTRVVASNMLTFFFSPGTSQVKRMTAMEKEETRMVAVRVLP